MELKVWCEGIQRVICGVTEATTCQDVVIALAQAMGKTGRYTLIEKWRESERFIAPDEHPVLALSKWGEYASDVQFILRLSGSRIKPQTNGDTSGADSTRTSKLSSHNFSPHLSESRTSSTSSLRKSLTFSGAHSRSHLVPNNEIRTRKRDKNGSLNDNSSTESLTERSSQSSHSTFMHSSPYSSMEHSQRVRLQDSISSQTSNSSLVHRTAMNNVNHAPSSPRGGAGHSMGGASYGSIERTRRRDPSRYNHVHQSSDTSANSSANSSNHIYPHREIPRSSPLRDRSSPFSRDLKPVPRESNNNIDFKPNANLNPADDKLDMKPTTETSISKTQEAKKKAELLQLVNSQLEKLQKQDSELKFLETAISTCQHFDHDVTDDRDIAGEIVRLEKFDQELDSEIQDLELVSWDGKLELELEKEKRIKSELTTTKLKLNNHIEQMQRMDNRLQELHTLLSEHKDKMSAGERQDKDRELKVITEISDLQKQINTHLVKHDKQQQSIDDLQSQVKTLESEILDRKTQIGNLEKEVKDSNMESFSRSPMDWMRGSQEGRSMFSRVSPTRPGSARMLDSPQRLKEAVPTSKNPHGLWV